MNISFVTELMPNMEPGMGDINVMVKPSSLKDKTPMCLVNELARYNRVSVLSKQGQVVESIVTTDLFKLF